MRASSYQVEVRGGIVTGFSPRTVRVRATSLSLRLRFRGEAVRHRGCVVVEIGNLPREVVVRHRGPVEVYSGGDSVVSVISLGKEPVEVELTASPPDRKGYTFWVGGDSRGRLDLLLEMLEKAHGENPLFVVLGGDLVKKGLWWEYDELLELLEEFPVPVFPVPGNHDLQFCGRRTFTRHLAPDHYYFTYQNDLFVVLDTNGGEGGQLEWLRGVLARAGYRHRFVFVHKPPFDPRPGMDHCMEDGDFARRLLEILERYGVDVLFCSHIHSFLETHGGRVRVIVTGGLGARRKMPIEPFHFVEVKVSREGITTRMIPLQAGQ